MLSGKTAATPLFHRPVIVRYGASVGGELALRIKNELAGFAYRSAAAAAPGGKQSVPLYQDMTVAWRGRETTGHHHRQVRQVVAHVTCIIGF
jgi:hypothetical protein